MYGNAIIKIDNKSKIKKMIVIISVLFFAPLIIYATGRYFKGFQNIFCGVTTILFWVAIIGTAITFLTLNSMRCEITVSENKLIGKLGLKDIDISFNSIKYLNKDGNNSIKLTTQAETIELKYLNKRDELYNIIRNSIGETNEEKKLAEIIKKGYRKRCKVCGKIICYTIGDLQKNKDLQTHSVLNSISSVAGAVSGHYAASSNSLQTSYDLKSRIVDYEKCPSCGSRDLVDITDEEIEQSKNPQNLQSISVVDELKNFKELLDSGIITQEEFDAKKKQLLGL